ncbi:hypothetical protein A3Q56_00506 [Intoshia linei]|uniref:Autophagy-related protein 13 n=1 Tax=Intoshia linei TaxID=1819745 RepID=A0A177BBZ3_9BILA|nr:hypothetical protein A3Q56_00506 [Intoshia linei]
MSKKYQDGETALLNANLQFEKMQPINHLTNLKSDTQMQKLSVSTNFEISNYLRNFYLKAIQIICQSRTGVPLNTPCRPPCPVAENKECSTSKNDDKLISKLSKNWFNIVLPENVPKLNEMKQVILDECLEPNQDICIEISICINSKYQCKKLNRINGENPSDEFNHIIIETWYINNEKIYSTNSNSMSYNIYHNMTQILKSLLLISRTLPAYQWAVDQLSSDKFSMCYKLYVGDRTIDNLADPYAAKHFFVGEVNTPLGIISMGVNYNRDILGIYKAKEELFKVNKSISENNKIICSSKIDKETLEDALLEPDAMGTKSMHYSKSMEISYLDPGAHSNWSNSHASDKTENCNLLNKYRQFEKPINSRKSILTSNSSEFCRRLSRESDNKSAMYDPLPPLNNPVFANLDAIDWSKYKNRKEESIDCIPFGSLFMKAFECKKLSKIPVTLRDADHLAAVTPTFENLTDTAYTKGIQNSHDDKVDLDEDIKSPFSEEESGHILEFSKLVNSFPELDMFKCKTNYKKTLDGIGNGLSGMKVCTDSFDSFINNINKNYNAQLSREADDLEGNFDKAETVKTKFSGKTTPL